MWVQLVQTSVLLYLFKKLYRQLFSLSTYLIHQCNSNQPIFELGYLGPKLYQVEGYPNLCSCSCNCLYTKLDNYIKTHKLNFNFPPYFPLNLGHIQTFLGPLNKLYFNKVKYERSVFKVEDGCELFLDWYPNKPDLEYEGYGCIILHGMGGGSHASYAQDLAYSLYERVGYPSLVLNYRGCNGSQLNGAKLYTAGCTLDLDQVLTNCFETLPKLKFIGVGFSIGGNILTNYLGLKGKFNLKPKVAAAISISNPFNLALCSSYLHSNPLSRWVYLPFLTQNLTKLYRQHQHHFPSHLQTKTWSSVQELETEFLIENQRIVDYQTKVPYNSLLEYHQLNSSAPVLKHVKVPMIFINAMDDPIVPLQAIPIDDIINNHQLLLMLTKYGGHLGWWNFYFQDWKVKSWLTLKVVELIQFQIEVLEKEN